MNQQGDDNQRLLENPLRQSNDRFQQQEEDQDSERLKELKLQLELIKNEPVIKVQRSGIIKTIKENDEIFFEIQNEGLLNINPKQVLKTDIEKIRRMENFQVDGTKENDVDFLKKDGIYIQKQINNYSLQNLNRMEQRLYQEKLSDLKENNNDNNHRSSWWDESGDMIIQREIYEDRNTKLQGIQYSENYQLLTFQRNAIVSDRSNQYKNSIFRMDILLGRMIIMNHPLFNEEDRLCSKLKKLIRVYKDRIDLALIPHLGKSIELMTKELDRLESMFEKPYQEIQIINNELNNATQQQKDEIQFIQQLMNKIYEVWSQIKKVRIDQAFCSNPLKLQVRQYTSSNQKLETEFSLANQDISRNNLPSNEIKRRANINKQRIFVRLKVNDKYIYRTKKLYLSWPMFEVNFMEKFQLYLYSKPKSIKIEIVTGNFFTQLIDTINLKIPGDEVNSITSAPSLYEEEEFIKLKAKKEPNQVKNEQHQPLASEDNIPLIDKQIGEIYQAEKQSIYEGSIFYKAEWVGFGPTMPKKSQQNIVVKKKKEKEEISEDVIQAKFIQELKEAGYHVDLNDPRNESLIKRLKELRDIQQSDNNAQSDVLMPFLQTTSYRQFLLKKRYGNPDLLDKKIPLLERQILENKELQEIISKIDQEEQEFKNITKQKMIANSGYFLQSELSNVEKYPQSIETKNRIQIIKKILDKQQKLNLMKDISNLFEVCSLRSVVNEFSFLEKYNPVALFLKQFFTQKRKLGQKSINVPKAETNQISKIKIKINIDHGSNIPVRTASKPIIKNQQERYTKMKQQLKFVDKQYLNPNFVNSQIQIKLFSENQEPSSIQSFCQEGPNPVWNQTLDLELRSKSGNFQYLEVVNETNRIILSLFDNLDSVRTAQNNPNRIVTTIKKQFLGSVTIPVLNLLKKNKISGIIKIQRPLILLGYLTLDQSGYSINSESLKENCNPMSGTHISVNIHNDPPIEFPNSGGSEYYPGKEDTQLLVYGTTWITQLKQQNPQLNSREIILWGRNIEGQSILSCKFLKSMKPPTYKGDQFDYVKAARFVSLIPWKSDCSEFGNLPEVWMTSQQFLDMRAGDEEEHAFLLANYFNYIDENTEDKQFKSFVLLAEDTIGQVILVMRQNIKDTSVELWDPKNGDVYEFKCSNFKTKYFCCNFNADLKSQAQFTDVLCCFKNIGCIIGPDNIWINIQKSSDASYLNYDLNNPKFWSPLFDPKNKMKFFPEGIQSIQSDIIYEEVEDSYPRRLEVQIEQYLLQQIKNQRQSIENDRLPYITRINKQASDKIKNTLLITLESFMYKVKCSESLSNQTVTEKAIKELEMIQNEVLHPFKENDKKIYGFPLNFTYTSLEKIWQDIQNTEILDVLSHEVEFVLSVSCFEYPNYIISTWIFVAAIVDE